MQKFNFRLQTVLEYRVKLVERQRLAVAAAEARVQAELGKLAALRASHAASQARLAAEQSGAGSGGRSAWFNAGWLRAGVARRYNRGAERAAGRGQGCPRGKHAIDWRGSAARVGCPASSGGGAALRREPFPDRRSDPD